MTITSFFSLHDCTPHPLKNSFVSKCSDVEDVEKLHLREGVRADILINSLNAVHIAAKKNHANVLTLLLTKNSILASSLTEDGRSALMIAAYEGNIEACRAIQSCVPITHLRDMNGNNALHYAVWGGHEAVVAFLVNECLIDANLSNKEGLLPIQLATANNSLHLLPYLSGANVESSSGLNCLHRGCMYGSLQVVKHLLLQEDIDFMVRTASGATALHLAAKAGHIDIVKCLLERRKDLNVNVTDNFYITPLHLACLG